MRDRGVSWRPALASKRPIWCPTSRLATGNGPPQKVRVVTTKRECPFPVFESTETFFFCEPLTAKSAARFRLLGNIHPEKDYVIRHRSNEDFFESETRQIARLRHERIGSLLRSCRSFAPTATGRGGTFCGRFLRNEVARHNSNANRPVIPKSPEAACFEGRLV